MTDYDRVGQALKSYSDEMKDYVLGRLKSHYGPGKEWLEAYLGSFRSDERRQNVVRTLQNSQTPEDAFDLNHVKDLLLANRDAFKDDFKRTFSRAVTWSDEVSEVRNRWAHQDDIPTEDVTRSLDSMARILVAIGSEEAAKRVKDLRDGVLPQSTGATKEGLPVWWKLAEPHEDIRKGNFDETTFAAKLDDVVGERAPLEYVLADEFYTKTYLTKELKGLLRDTLKRLSGTGGEAVVQLRTPFGGGKTHALIALYHLIKKAADIEEMEEIGALLRDAGLEHIPHARVATLVGTSLSAQGRTTEEGIQANTLWGELAYQLGGKAGYALVEGSDKAKTSPGTETLRPLLERYARALILLDEVLVYQVKAAGERVGDTTLQAQTFAFFQELTEAVGSVPGVALITTFPESHLEYYDHEQAPGVFARLEKIFGRVQAVRVPVQGEEIFEVIRRRLFQNIDDHKARHVVSAYQKLYESYRDDLPSSIRSGDYTKRMLRAYPFHPELITVLYERWGTIQTFQRTRGVLRLLARVIEYSYLSGSARPLLSLGDVGLEDPQLRTTITSILQDANWDAVIGSDISPPDGKAFELDKELGGEYSKQRLAQTTATAIFMYSHSGGAERGASEPGLRLALLEPEGISQTLISDALNRMKGRLYYLYSNGGWSFRAQPNLNAVLSDRMAQVAASAVQARVKEAVASRTGSGLFKAHVWPENHKEVPDNHQLKVVLLKPEQTVDDEGAFERILSTIQNNHASGPRVNKNTLVYLTGKGEDFSRTFQETRTLLALEEIAGDRGLVLSQDQKDDLQKRLRTAAERLPEMAKACYTVMYEPYDTAKNEYRVHDLSAQVKTQPNVLSAVVETLRAEDRLLAALDPGLLINPEPYRLWPEGDEGVNLKSLRGYFERFPHLPMLESNEVLKNAISRGVQNGLFELALESGEDYSQVWRRENPPRDRDIFFESHYLLTRVGFISRPEVPEQEPAPQPTAAVGVSQPPGEASRGKVVAKTDKTTQVCLQFDSLELGKIATLVDVVGALQDAGGNVRIQVGITATNPQGLDRTMLELNVREVLMQNALEAEWEEF